ncbi:hypothetical protein [Propionivibrio sp.]|uniref:hypothetical protein n=1 Tax=Propionivibrio sp. TaxID=2212460 RepID=UPI0026229599|nr:hypothetical protein [Propionivibrio sp.]
MKSKIDWIRRAQRAIRMLAELHRLGYQGLRGMPYLNPLGFRLAIAPKRYFSERNGAVIPQSQLTGSNVAITGAGDYFGWMDTANDDARTLAQKFIERFPEIANQGKERDWAYAGWLAELVGFLEQGDWIPTLWWENMKGNSEDLQTLPIWIADQDNLQWEGIASVISPENPSFPLPPISINHSNTASSEERTIWWGEQRYWTDALDAICLAMEDGGRLVTIDVKKIESHLFDGDGPAYMLLEAMKSVIEHEGYDGYKGAPRLVKALLWKLQEISES